MDVFQTIALVLGIGMPLFALLAWAFRLLSGNPIQTLNAKRQDINEEADEATQEPQENEAVDGADAKQIDANKDKE